MATDEFSHSRSRWADMKARVQIPQMLTARGLDSGFRISGPRWVGPCPLHGGDNRTAFVVHTEKNVWFCFTRCGGGDSLDLAYRLCGRSWPLVARWLTQLAGQHPPADLARRPPPPTIRPSSLDRPFRPFRHTLTLDPAHPFFGRMQIAPATLRTFEAGAWHGSGFLEGTVAVRLHDLEGRPLGYAGRRLDPDAIQSRGKWKLPTGFPKGQLLYNWHRARPYLSRGLVVVEGAWSVMKLWQAGFQNAVAIGGAAPTAHQSWLLRRASSIVLMLDGDATGDAATARVVDAGLHPHLTVARCPLDKDPADLPEGQLRDMISRAAAAAEATVPDRERRWEQPRHA